MFNHVKCKNCKTQYNGKTGQSNQRSIILYIVVSFVLAFLACGAFAVFAALVNN
jgi:hypothetical protein